MTLCEKIAAHYQGPRLFYRLLDILLYVIMVSLVWSLPAWMMAAALVVLILATAFSYAEGMAVGSSHK